MAGSNPFAQNLRISNADPASAFQKRQTQNFDFGARSSVPELRSTQSNIVNSRSNQVSQHFGQITPPHDDLSEPVKAHSSKPSQSQQHRGQENGKLTNEQRARNAANTRHSRSKNTKKRSEQNRNDSDDEGTQKQGKNITLQREKNRVAAAKCRAKKKSANEEREELANEYGATNNFLTREIRDLKNQKKELQNFLLAHRPGVCDCHGIHDYNFGQAQRLVLNARRHGVEPTSSPSLESAFSTQSSGSEASAAGMLSAQNRVSPPETLGMPSRRPSFSGPMNYAFSQNTNPETMQTANTTARGGQHMSHEFAEFLQSSPGGRAGFS